MRPHTMMCLAKALHCGTMLGTSAHNGHRAIKGLSLTLSYFKPARITMTSLHGSVLRASAVTCILVLPPAVGLPWRFHWYRSTVSLTWGRPSSDHRAGPAMPMGPAPPLRNALWLGIHAWFFCFCWSSATPSVASWKSVCVPFGYGIGYHVTHYG
jgi:hypothetical protein